MRVTQVSKGYLDSFILLHSLQVGCQLCQQPGPLLYVSLELAPQLLSRLALTHSSVLTAQHAIVKLDL